VRITLIFSIIYCATLGCDSTIKKDEPTTVDRNKELVGNYESGKTLFTTYCRACHFPPESKHGHNYAFHNLFDRLPQPAEKYLMDFLKNSKALRDSGDKYALELDKYWPHNEYEHKFADSLTTSQLSDLFFYIKVGVRLNSNSK